MRVSALLLHNDERQHDDVGVQRARFMDPQNGARLIRFVGGRVQRLDGITLDMDQLHAS
jgi:hypothetical protein